LILFLYCSEVVRKYTFFNTQILKMAKKTQAEVIKELQYNPEVVILNNPLSAPKLVRKLGKGKELQLNEIYAPKLFYDIVSRITPEHLKQFDEGKTTVTLSLSIKDFLKSVNAGNSKSLYTHVVNCIDLLQTTQVKWSDVEKDYGTTIITHYEHHKGTGKIDLVLYKELVKKVVEVSQNEHFSFLKKHLYRLQNAQAIKLFPYFVSWRNRSMVEVELETFKRKFGYDTEGYRFFNNLRNKVLDPAISEINEKTELTVSYKLLGDNLDGMRPRVKGLQFFIQERKKQALLTDGKKNDTIVKQPVNEQNNPNEDLINQYYEQIADFWGVDKPVFIKTAADKSEPDIQRAIEYTKEQVRAGKAVRPAAVFIDALKNGYKTTDEIKKEIADKKTREIKTKITAETQVEKTLFEEKKQQQQTRHEKHKAIFNRLITDDAFFSSELLNAIETNNMIKGYYDFEKDLTSNMENPMLAGAILNIALKIRPADFK
jgi:plasmid replication initiation protein